MPWQPAPPLTVSPSDRAILEAIIGSREIPKRVKKRARIVLLAAGGAANHAIAAHVDLARARVLHWRLRFEQEGIRGLWDREGGAEGIPEKVERAIVEDCLYCPRLSQWIDWDASLNWNVRNLARRHGVSQSSVQRIWKKHGIRMRRYYHGDLGVDVEKLKISEDPLFAVTVYEIAGLFYEHANPVLALCSRERPFSEVQFSPISLQERLTIVDDLSSRFRQLEARALHAEWQDPDWEKFNKFLQAIYDKPRHAGAQMHLLLGTAVRFTVHPCISMHHAPWSASHPRWGAWVERWLKAIAAWPMQPSLVASASRMRNRLDQLTKEASSERIVIR